jgi:hypothetical protein
MKSNSSNNKVTMTDISDLINESVFTDVNVKSTLCLLLFACLMNLLLKILKVTGSQRQSKEEGRAFI